MPTAKTPIKAEMRWLTCRIDKGMFSDELVVTYPVEGTLQKSVFVAASDVEGVPEKQGRVRVRVVPSNGHIMAVLPSADQDIVSVREADLTT
jgi:hypothetical protein